MNRELKHIKKINFIKILVSFVLVFIALFAAACTQQPRNYQPNEVFPCEYEGFTKNRKVYLTSIGQSNDIITIELILDTIKGINVEVNSLLYADEVEQNSVVIVAVGCSIKGLGEVGLTTQAEFKRAEAFVEKASKGVFDIVSIHIGGAARRGSTSDTFIEYLFSHSDFVLFSSEGNTDLKLSDWAISGNVAYCQFDKNTQAVLRKLLGEEIVND